MAQPTRYARAYSFTGYQTADPSDPLPAQRVDAEFDAVALTTDETRLNLALVQRDDGKLRNASVHPDALDSSTLLLLGSDRWTPRGAWAAATVYAIGDMVESGDGTYVATAAHLSGDFAVDRASSKWLPVREGADRARSAYDPVRVATTENLVLSGLKVIDGVLVDNGDRVLVKNQTAPVENGIFVASASGWSRATDLDETEDFVTGATVRVNGGSSLAGKTFALTAATPVSIGTTPITWGFASASASVETMAALRDATDPGVTEATTLGYYTPGDGAGGSFIYDPLDTTSADDGGSVIVGATGMRWKRSDTSGLQNVRCWGAKGDGVTSDTAPFMGCIAYQEMLGGRVTVPLGDYPVDLFINDGNLRIECEPGTILRAANTNPVVTVSDTVTGPFVLTDADIRGQYKAQEGVVVGTHPNGFGYENTVGLHGLAVYGPNATLERCKLRGFRYDSLYGRVDVNVNGGWANFRAIDCDFGDCARNVVSLVDGHGWYFTRGSVWNEGRYWSSSHGFKSLYLFDIEPAGAETVTHVYCDGVHFLAGSPVSGSHQFINGSPGTADGYNHTFVTNCRFGRYGTGGIATATIRTRGDVSVSVTKGLHVANSSFEDRLIANTGASNLIDCHFTDLVLAGHPLFNATLDEGTSFTNVYRPDGVALALTFATGAKVAIKNCTGVPDRLPALSVMGDAAVTGGVDVTAGFQALATVGSTPSGHVIFTKAGDGTLGSNVQQLVITPLAQSAMYCEVGITSQASGSGQARRARLARLAFMVTKANSGAPVIDLIAAQDIAEMLSSLPPVGDRDPGVMGAAVAVVGETVVVTISNSVTSGANPLIVTVSVNAWGRRVERSIFA